MEYSTRILNYINNELLSRSFQDAVSSDADLLLSGKLDSLGVMSLISFIERELALAIPASDVTIENFASVDTIVEYLNTVRDPKTDD